MNKVVINRHGNLVCSCGNTANQAGFHSSSADGDLTQRDGEKVNLAGHSYYKCLNCDTVFKPPSPDRKRSQSAEESDRVVRGLDGVYDPTA